MVLGRLAAAHRQHKTCAPVLVIVVWRDGFSRRYDCLLGATISSHWASYRSDACQVPWSAQHVGGALTRCRNLDCVAESYQEGRVEPRSPLSPWPRADAFLVRLSAWPAPLATFDPLGLVGRSINECEVSLAHSQQLLLPRAMRRSIARLIRWLFSFSSFLNLLRI